MIKKIESYDNKKIKLVRKLSSRRMREEENKFVIEGINLLSEAISKNATIDYIIASSTFNLDLLQKKIDISLDLLSIYIVDENIFRKISQIENGNTVIGVAMKTNYEDVISAGSNILVLDRIQDPGNIGSIIRSAVAFKYEAIVVMKGTADVFSPKVLRATAGMIFDMNFIFADSIENLKRLISKYNKKLIATVVKDGKPLEKIKIKNDLAVVIGNEGNGVSEEVLELAEEKITISVSENVESLNVAVATGIILYELQA